MAKKTFKIGERAIGGIIQVIVTKSDITVSALDWNTKETLSTYSVSTSEKGNWMWDISGYVENLTSYYYAEIIMKYIRAKLKEQ